VCNRSRRGLSPNDSRHTLLRIDKPRPPMGASRTTIPSTGGKVSQQYLSHNRPCVKLTQIGKDSFNPWD